MLNLIEFFNHYGILIAATLATVGWIITVRVNTSNSRNAHTFNIVTNRDFNVQFREALREIRPYLSDKTDKFPGRDKIDKNIRKEIKRSSRLKKISLSKQELKSQVRQKKYKVISCMSYVLNHYEFLCAGIRNGDISEKLVKDSERSTIILLFETFEGDIEDLRVARKREAVYEHLEWIYDRWDHRPPGLAQQILEMVLNRPLYGRISTKNTVIWLLLVGVFLAMLLPHHRILDDDFYNNLNHKLVQERATQRD